jgi:hypothetical protein
MKNYLKTYEEWIPGDNVPTTDNSITWVIGLPSGEAIPVNRDGVNALFKEKLIKYTTKYVDTGFYAFDDKDVDLIKKYDCGSCIIVPAEKMEKKDILIFKHNFDEELIDKLLEIINEFPKYVEFYVEDDKISLMMEKGFHIIVKINNERGRGKYSIERKHKDQIIYKYDLVSDRSLIIKMETTLQEEMKKERSKQIYGIGHGR